MPIERRVAQVKQIQDRLSRCTIAVATDPTNINVNTLNDLRQRLRDRGIQYQVVKNTLTYLAADGAGVPGLRQVVQGPTGLAFGYQDPAEVASALEDYIRTTRSTLVIRGGILGQRTLSSADVTRLASMPPRAELVAQVLGQLQGPVAGLLGQLQAPLQRLMNALNGPASQLASLLEQRAQQLRQQEGG